MCQGPASSDAGALLIAPGGLGDGPAHRAQAEAMGMRVIGASSLKDDPAAGQYRDWAFLPHVADPGFKAALARLIAERGITRMHATHYLVWRNARDALAELAPHVTLTLGRTFLDLEGEYRDLRRRVADERPIETLADRPPLQDPLNAVQTAGFLRAAMAIPGESYEDKLLALMRVAPHTPSGDLVEIGCLFGRTAALLALLARRYDLGRVLCVDPWSREELDQGAEALHAPSLDYDWPEWRRIFEINVAPFALGRLNYIQATGEAGGKAYARSREVATEAFGRTLYEGRIGLLHIDGNHEYGHVLADAEAWTPWLAPSGWVVFDDYDWDWGDGVRRVADAFVERTPIQTRFVVSGALFVQVKG